MADKYSYWTPCCFSINDPISLIFNTADGVRPLRFVVAEKADNNDDMQLGELGR